ncbi:hypothetical protein IFR05_006411 [Cadophora sp. M221]|nr:hypothetical protein IFR05_006411 [Cadophora sp. M221]
MTIESLLVLPDFAADKDGSRVLKSHGNALSSMLDLDFSKMPLKGDVTVEVDSVSSSSASIVPPSLNSAELSDNTASSTPADGSLSPTTDSFWKGTTRPLYEDFLRGANYPAEFHQKYVTFFDEFIIAALGPIPSSISAWTPHLTKDHSPFEPSWNIQGSKQQIRFSIEPVGQNAGTDLDPLSQERPLAFVESLSAKKVCSGLDTEWWKHFTSELFLSNSEIQTLQSLSPPAKMTPTCFLAFDLPSEKFAPILKAYLFPHRRALLSGKSTTQCVIDSAKKLHSTTTSVLPTLAHIEAFLSKKQSTVNTSVNKVISNLGGEEQEKSIEMMAIDCISPSKARIKLYVKENIASFANVKNMYTLGGRRSGAEVDEGLAAFEKFWVSLFGDTESTQFNSAFLFLGLEIIPGVEMPDIKLYVPAWTCPIGDEEITARLGSYFTSQNWAIGSTYDDDFQKICGNGEGMPVKASYTYLSFAYSSAKGPYVTLYYSPNISQLGTF